MRIKEFINEAANPAQQAAIAIAMKKAGKKPKNEGYAMEDEQVNGMAQGEIREIIRNAVKIKEKLDSGTSLDGWMYSYVTTSNDRLNSVAEQIGNPNIDEGYLDEFALGSDDDREPDEEEILRQLAAQWWLGTEQQMAKAQRTLEAMGWEIGQDESGDDDAGVFLIRPGDVNGDTYIAFNHSDLELNEGENWSKYNHKRVGGMSKKSVASYRRSHPGSKIQTAVTTKPSKLKKGSKAAARRKSFCARMRGMKKHRTGAKTANDPNSNINKSLRRWHCESVEQLEQLVMLAEQKIRNLKK